MVLVIDEQKEKEASGREERQDSENSQSDDIEEDARKITECESWLKIRIINHLIHPSFLV